MVNVEVSNRQELDMMDVLL